MTEKMNIKIWDGQEFTFEIGETLLENEKYGVKLVSSRCTGPEDWDEELPLLIWGDDTIMSPKDWQTVQGKTPEEIIEINHWVDLRTGEDTVRMNGIPFLPPNFFPPKN